MYEVTLKDESQQKQFNQQIFALELIDLSSEQLKQSEEIFSDNLQNIKQWPVTILALTQFNVPIFKPLLSISFPNLKDLQLRENNIISIEGMSKADFKNLQVLFLGKNKLSTVRELRKGNYPLLRNIDLDENFIKDVQSLNFMKISEKLIDIDLEWRQCPQMCPSISWIGKVPAKELTYLLILSEDRIRQPQVKKVLHKKLKSLQILEDD